MDTELHATARQLLAKRYEEQKTAGMIEVLPVLPEHELKKLQPPVSHQRQSVRPGLAAYTVLSTSSSVCITADCMFAIDNV